MDTVEYKQFIITSKYIDFLYKTRKIAKNKIAAQLNIAPGVLSNLINEDRVDSRTTFTDLNKIKFTREEIIRKIESLFGLSIDEKHEIVEKHPITPQFTTYEQIDYFVYHHLEYNSNAVPIFAKWLLIIISDRQNRTAELQILKGNKIITYVGEVLEEPQQLILRLIKKGKPNKIEDSIIFIKTEEGELNFNILYGTFQSSGPKFGLAVLEKSPEPISIVDLHHRETPPEIVLDLLNQQFSPDGNFDPLNSLAQHPQHNLIKNLVDFFGVYEGTTLVPSFDQLNHFTFEYSEFHLKQSHAKYCFIYQSIFSLKHDYQDMYIFFV